jgi:hypothetical protein
VAHQDATGRWGFLSEPTAFRVGSSDVSPPPAPGGLRLERASPRSVSLRWDPAPDPQSGILGYVLQRDGVRITRQPVSGTSQQDFGAKPGARHAYRVVAVNNAGLSSPPSAELEVDVPAGGLGGWAVPPGGWDYLYDAEPGEDLYVDARYYLDPRYLDGTWDRSALDAWDGSRPGGHDGAPGGVGAETVPGAAEDGGSASVLSLEDPGDPRGGSPFENNRRLLFLHGAGAEDPFARGVTLIARFRVHPAPLDVPPSPGQAAEGPAFRGQLGIGYRGAARRAHFSFWLADGGLHTVTGDAIPLSAAELAEFQSYWVVLEEQGGAERVRVYRGASAAPVIDSLIALPASGVEGGLEGAYLEMGLANTAEAGAIQVDYFGYAAGVHLPAPEGAGEARLIRGDVDADGVLGAGDPFLLLGYLFRGGGGVDCLDAADADDSGRVNVSDAVLLFRRLFGLVDSLPAPFPDCGEDPSADALPPCSPARCGG